MSFESLISTIWYTLFKNNKQYASREMNLKMLRCQKSVEFLRLEIIL